MSIAANDLTLVAAAVVLAAIGGEFFLKDVPLNPLPVNDPSGVMT